MQPDQDASREELLHRAVCAGDERAWKALYDESFDALHRYVAWRCGGCNELAEEVVQETWLTAVRRIRRFRPQRGRFRDWLAGIAANVLRNQLRRRKRRRVTPLAGEPATEAGRSSGVDADQDRAERVAAALAALPEHYEAVLRAKYFHHQSVAEIAAEQGKSNKSVESLLTRARGAFRKLYQDTELRGNTDG